LLACSAAVNVRVVTDRARTVFNNVGTRPAFTADQTLQRDRDGLAHISKQFVRYGLTSVHHEGGNLFALQQVRERGNLLHRVSYEASGKVLEAMIAGGLSTSFGDERIRLGATSEHTVDGSFSERTMAMSGPYAGMDPNYRGNVTETQDDLDKWVEPLLRNAKPGTPVVTVTDGLPDMDGNPHMWFDPALARKYVEKIRDGLIALDPAGRDVYAANAKAYSDQLVSLETELRAKVATIPAERRRLVTSHDAFPYFAKAFGFEIVGFAQPEPDKMPSAGELADLVNKVKAAKVPAKAKAAPPVSPGAALVRRARKVVQQMTRAVKKAGSRGKQAPAKASVARRKSKRR